MIGRTSNQNKQFPVLSARWKSPFLRFYRRRFGRRRNDPRDERLLVGPFRVTYVLNRAQPWRDVTPVILADAVSRPRRDKSSAGSGGVVAQKPGRREKSIPPRRAPLRDAFGTRANACVRVFARDSRRAERAENESRLRVSSRIWKSHVGEMWNELCRVE